MSPGGNTIGISIEAQNRASAEFAKVVADLRNIQTTVGRVTAAFRDLSRIRVSPSAFKAQDVRGIGMLAKSAMSASAGVRALGVSSTTASRGTKALGNSALIAARNVGELGTRAQAAVGSVRALANATGQAVGQTNALTAGLQSLRPTLQQLRILVNQVSKQFERFGGAEFIRGFGNLGVATGSLIAQWRDLNRVLRATVVAQGAAAVSLERLQVGLRVISGGAQEAQEQYERLIEVARLPGINLENALRASLQLQAIGNSGERAAEIIARFGNALALSGQPASELRRVVEGIRQIVGEGRVLQEDIGIITSRVATLVPLLREFYGGTRAADIRNFYESIDISGSGQGARFVEDVIRLLQQLPMAGNTAANAIENLGDTFDRAQAAIGRSFLPIIRQATMEIEGALQAIERDPQLAHTIALFETFAGVLGSVGLGLGALRVAIQFLGPTIAGAFTGPVGLAIGTAAALAAIIATASVHAANARNPFLDLKEAIEANEAAVTKLRDAESSATGAKNALRDATSELTEAQTSQAAIEARILELTQQVSDGRINQAEYTKLLSEEETSLAAAKREVAAATERETAAREANIKAQREEAALRTEARQNARARFQELELARTQSQEAVTAAEARLAAQDEQIRQDPEILTRDRSGKGPSASDAAFRAQRLRDLEIVGRSRPDELITDPEERRAAEREFIQLVNQLLDDPGLLTRERSGKGPSASDRAFQDNLENLRRRLGVSDIEFSGVLAEQEQIRIEEDFPGLNVPQLPSANQTTNNLETLQETLISLLTTAEGGEIPLNSLAIAFQRLRDATSEGLDAGQQDVQRITRDLAEIALELEEATTSSQVENLLRDANALRTRESLRIQGDPTDEESRGNEQLRQILDALIPRLETKLAVVKATEEATRAQSRAEGEAARAAEQTTERQIRETRRLAQARQTARETAVRAILDQQRDTRQRREADPIIDLEELRREERAIQSLLDRFGDDIRVNDLLEPLFDRMRDLRAEIAELEQREFREGMAERLAEGFRMYLGDLAERYREIQREIEQGGQRVTATFERIVTRFESDDLTFGGLLDIGEDIPGAIAAVTAQLETTQARIAEVSGGFGGAFAAGLLGLFDQETQLQSYIKTLQEMQQAVADSGAAQLQAANQVIVYRDELRRFRDVLSGRELDFRRLRPDGFTEITQAAAETAQSIQGIQEQTERLDRQLESELTTEQLERLQRTLQSLRDNFGQLYDGSEQARTLLRALGIDVDQLGMSFTTLGMMMAESLDAARFQDQLEALERGIGRVTDALARIAVDSLFDTLFGGDSDDSIEGAFRLVNDLQNLTEGLESVSFADISNNLSHILGNIEFDPEGVRGLEDAFTEITISGDNLAAAIGEITNSIRFERLEQDRLRRRGRLEEDAANRIRDLEAQRRRLLASRPSGGGRAAEQANQRIQDITARIAEARRDARIRLERFDEDASVRQGRFIEDALNQAFERQNREEQQDEDSGILAEIRDALRGIAADTLANAISNALSTLLVAHLGSPLLGALTGLGEIIKGLFTGGGDGDDTPPMPPTMPEMPEPTPEEIEATGKLNIPAENITLPMDPIEVKGSLKNIVVAENAMLPGVPGLKGGIANVILQSNATLPVIGGLTGQIATLQPAPTLILPTVTGITAEVTYTFPELPEGRVETGPLEIVEDPVTPPLTPSVDVNGVLKAVTVAMDATLPTVTGLEGVISSLTIAQGLTLLPVVLPGIVNFTYNFPELPEGMVEVGPITPVAPPGEGLDEMMETADDTVDLKGVIREVTVASNAMLPGIPNLKGGIGDVILQNNAELPLVGGLKGEIDAVTLAEGVSLPRLTLQAEVQISRVRGGGSGLPQGNVEVGELTPVDPPGEGIDEDMMPDDAISLTGRIDELEQVSDAVRQAIEPVKLKAIINDLSIDSTALEALQPIELQGIVYANVVYLGSGAFGAGGQTEGDAGGDGDGTPGPGTGRGAGGRAGAGGRTDIGGTPPELNIENMPGEGGSGQNLNPGGGNNFANRDRPGGGQIGRFLTVTLANSQIRQIAQETTLMAIDGKLMGIETALTADDEGMGEGMGDEITLAHLNEALGAANAHLATIRTNQANDILPELRKIEMNTRTLAELPLAQAIGLAGVDLDETGFNLSTESVDLISGFQALRNILQSQQPDVQVDPLTNEAMVDGVKVDTGLEKSLQSLITGTQDVNITNKSLPVAPAEKAVFDTNVTNETLMITGDVDATISNETVAVDVVTRLMATLDINAQDLVVILEAAKDQGRVDGTIPGS